MRQRLALKFTVSLLPSLGEISDCIHSDSIFLDTYSICNGLRSRRLTTFATILGRYNYYSSSRIGSCCSVLEQEAGCCFIPNLKMTFRDFATGVTKTPQLRKQSSLKYILNQDKRVRPSHCRKCLHTCG